MSSAWKLPRVTLLVHTILRWWSVDFWKICVLLVQTMGGNTETYLKGIVYV